MTPEEQQLWTLIALVYGWNELAKHQDSIGRKMFCRMMRAQAEKAVIATGHAGVPMDGSNPVTFTLDAPVPGIEFRESDWKLIRKALAEHDAKGGG